MYNAVCNPITEMILSEIFEGDDITIIRTCFMYIWNLASTNVTFDKRLTSHEKMQPTLFGNIREYSTTWWVFGFGGVEGGGGTWKWILLNDYAMIISPWYILYLLVPVVLCLGVSDNVYILYKRDTKWLQGCTWGWFNGLMRPQNMLQHAPSTAIC